MNITVIGAGNGGHSMGAHLTMEGHKVKLFDINEKIIAKINENGGIKAEGVIEGIASLKATTDVEKAMSDTEVVMVTTTCTSHKKVAESIAPYLKDDQIILIFPGYWGAIEFSNVLEEVAEKKRIHIAETESLIYTCRYIEPGHVNVRSIKNKLEFATYPSEDVNEVYERLKEVYPQLEPKDSVLRTTLNNVNPMFHVPITLLNAGRIESKGDFYFYPEGATKSVVNIIEKIDQERLALGKALDIELNSSLELLKRFYKVEEDNLFDGINKNKAYQTGKAPTTLNYRYIYEDITYGLVPMSEIGKVVGVDTSNIDLLINLGSALVDKDLRSMGLTLDKLGINLEELSKEEVLEQLNY